MELGLSLGDASNSSVFNENASSSNRQQNLTKKSGLDFSITLGLNSGNQEREKSQKSDENEDHDGSDQGDGNDVNEGENPVQLNLLPLAPVPRPILCHLPSLPRSSDNGSSENGSSGNTGLLAAKGLDANSLPAAEEVSSANSVGSPFHMDFDRGYGNLHLCGSKRDFEATGSDAAEAERASPRTSDDDGNARKKLRLSKEQSAFLEESFKEHNTLDPKQKFALAKQLNLRPRQVEVWFQNRRARTKLKQTEEDCDYLKRCCETLTDENRRLQKELQELRALKTSNPFCTQLPATTLTMCPSCERAPPLLRPPSQWRRPSRFR